MLVKCIGIFICLSERISFGHLPTLNKKGVAARLQLTPRSIASVSVKQTV